MKQESVVKGATPRSETRALIEAALSMLDIGEILEWHTIEALTGRPRAELYTIANSARDALMRKSRMHYKTVSGTGIERIDDQCVATEVLPKQSRKLRGVAKKTLRVVARVDLEQVKPESRMSVIAHATLASLTEQAATPKAIKSLEVSSSTQSLSPSEIMRRLLASE